MTTISTRPVGRTQIVQRPANAQAEALTGRPYVSFSQISQMRSCPRKFAFHYIEHARPDFIPASLIFGTAVHGAVEVHFRGNLAGVVTSHGDLLQAYKLAWAEQKAQSGAGLPIQYSKDQDEGALEELAGRILTAFLAAEAANPPGMPLGVEEELCVRLSADLPDVLARVDLVYETADAVVVRDIKTSRSKWSADNAGQSADQLLLYGRIIRDIAGSVGKPVRGEYVVLTKQKTPHVQVLPVEVTAEAIRRTQIGIATTWQAILAGNFLSRPQPHELQHVPVQEQMPGVLRLTEPPRAEGGQMHDLQLSRPTPALLKHTCLCAIMAMLGTAVLTVRLMCWLARQIAGHGRELNAPQAQASAVPWTYSTTQTPKEVPYGTRDRYFYCSGGCVHRG